MPVKVEKTVLFLMAAVYLVYLVLRAWYIPMTHDEASTCFNQVPRGLWDVLTYESDAVPNNHILNTLGIKLFTGIFGMGKMAARIPALLGGIAYLLGAAAFARRIGSNGWLRTAWFLVLLCNPFMAEFFALARGYGLSIGLMMPSIYYTWQYLGGRRLSDLKGALLWGGLAVWANFTVLNYYVPMILLLFLAVRQQTASAAVRRSQLGQWGAGVLLLGLLCALPIYRMQAANELRFWGTAGFMQDTFYPLLRCTIMGHPYFDQYTLEGLTALIVSFSLIGWVVAVWRWGNRRWLVDQDPLVFAGFLFAGTIVFNLLQFHLLNVPLLNSRTAVFLYPLFAIQLIAAGELLCRQWGRVAWAYALPLAVFAFTNFNNNRNLTQSQEWPFDRGTVNVLEYLKKQYQAEGRTAPYTLDTNWILQNSINFHIEFTPYTPYVKMPPYHNPQPPKGDSEFFYTASREDLDALKDSYEPVLTIQEGLHVLLRKKR